MSLLAALLAFAPLAALMTLTPGADFTLVLRQAVSRGPRAAALTGLGVCAGVIVWGAAAAAGVAAVFAAHPGAYRVLSFAGAGYLGYLGVRMVLATFRRGSASEDSSQPGPTPGDGWARSFRQGFVTNLLNPKIGVFYVALIPQFPVDGVSPVLVGLSLAGLHTLFGGTFFAVMIYFSHAARRVLSREGVRRALDRVCGAALLAFGTGVAVTTARAA